MKSIYLLSFILVLASASFGVDISYYQSPPAGLYPCLARENAKSVVLEIFDAQGNVFSQRFLRNYIIAKDAKIKTVDAIARINDYFTEDEICNTVAGGLPAKFDGTVWLEVKNERSLWSQDVKFRLGYLDKLVKVCQSHGLKVGIYSSAANWVGVLGYLGIGTDTLNAVPVWYSNSNGKADFDDFDSIGFGAWNAPTMKSYVVNEYICDKIFVVSQNYFEA